MKIATLLKKWTLFGLCILCISLLFFSETRSFAFRTETKPESSLEEELETSVKNPLKPSEDVLLFTLNYVYRAGGKGDFEPLKEESVLHSGDHYKIIFTPGQDGYVYIFQVDSANKIYSLFPMQHFGEIQVNNLNPVQAGKTYYLPAEKKSFVLDRQTGTERIYFLASRQRDVELENQYQRVFQMQQQQKGLEEQLQQIDRLLSYAMEAKGTADMVEASAEADTMTWQEAGQLFSILQHRLENMCDGCVHVLTFAHD